MANNEYFITPPHWQPQAVFRGFSSISGGWMLLCKELIMAEESPHMSMQCIASFCCSLGVPVGYLSVYIGFFTTTWVFSIAVSPRDYQSDSHSPPSVFVQAASTEVMATTAVRHVAPAAVSQTRATLSTERVLVPLTTGKHQCVQVRRKQLHLAYS